MERELKQKKVKPKIDSLKKFFKKHINLVIFSVQDCFMRNNRIQNSESSPHVSTVSELRGVVDVVEEW